MVKMIQNKKGFVGLVLIIGLISIFVVSVVYIIASQPFEQVTAKIKPNLSAEHQQTVEKIESNWENWPILVIFGIILWVFVMIMKGQSNDYAQ